MGVVLVAAYWVVPGVVLLPYGSQFTSVRPFLAPFGTALALLAVANLLVNYFLSVGSARFAGPLLGACALETLLMVAFHRDLGQLLSMLLLTTAVLAVSLGLLYLLDRRRGRRQMRSLPK